MDISTYVVVIGALISARVSYRERVKFWFDAAREDRNSMTFRREECIENAMRSYDEWKKVHNVLLNTEKLFKKTC